MSESLMVKAMLGYFLEDIDSNSGKLQLMPAELMQKMEALTFGMSFDTDEPIEGPVNL